MAMEGEMELLSAEVKMAAKVEITEDYYSDANKKLQQTDRSATALSVRIVTMSLQRVFVFPV
jgi:hypothetical protein